MSNITRTNSADEHPFIQFNGLLNGSWFIFFMISVASSRLGGLFKHVGLPLITGYMVIGILCGPFVLNMVKNEQIPDLAYVTQTALAFIAFSAGSELYLPELRSLFKVITSLTVCTALSCYIFCSLIIFSMSGSHAIMPWLADYPSSCAFFVSLIAGSIMVARSPASAIAVVRELHAKGPLTSTMLGVTVVGDVVVLLLFTLSSAMALASCDSNGFQGAEFLITILSLIFAVCIGYGLGYFFIFLLWLKKIPFAKYTIILWGLLMFLLCDWFEIWSAKKWGVSLNFDALLICITAGYVVTNQSHNRMAFMTLLGGLGPYIVIPFFTKVGLELDLKVLYESIGFAIIVFLVRCLCMFGGGWVGSMIGGLKAPQKQYCWLTMLSQAGVSLGLASEISVKFSKTWGPPFSTAIFAVVLINQFVGPVACKFALKQVKEDNKMYDEVEHEDEDEEKQGHIKTVNLGLRRRTHRRCVILGIDSTTLATAQRLLVSQTWEIVIIDTNEAQLKNAESYLMQAMKKLSSPLSPLNQAGKWIKGLIPGSNPFQNSSTSSTSSAANVPVVSVNPPASPSTPAQTDKYAELNETASDEPQLHLDEDPTINDDDDAPASRLQIQKLTVSSGQTFVQALQALESEFLIQPDTVDALLVSLPDDYLMYDVCSYLTDQRRYSRVLARIHHNGWSNAFAGLGVIPIDRHSIEIQLMTQLLNPNEHGSSNSDSIFIQSNEPTQSDQYIPFIAAPITDITSNTLTIPDLMNSIISEDDLKLRLAEMENAKRSAYIRSHPAPPPSLAAAGPRHLSFGGVVSESQKASYLGEIFNVHNAHANTSFSEIISKKDRAASNDTFMGPSAQKWYSQRNEEKVWSRKQTLAAQKRLSALGGDLSSIAHSEHESDDVEEFTSSSTQQQQQSLSPRSNRAKKKDDDTASPEERKGEDVTFVIQDNDELQLTEDD